MQYVTIEHVTSLAYDNLGKTGQPPHRFIEWAYDAEISIGPSWNNNRNVLIPLEESGVVEKPCGYIYGLEVALARMPDTPAVCPDLNQTDVANLFTQLRAPECFLVYPIYRGKVIFAYPHTSSRNLQRPHGLGVNYAGITFSEDDRNFYFDSVGNTGLNTVFVSFMGTPIDDNGDIKIPESHARAVAAYIEWMELKRMRRQNVGQTVYPSEVKDAQQTWLQLKMSAYGRDKSSDPLELREAVLSTVTMIQKISRSRSYDYRSNHNRR